MVQLKGEDDESDGEVVSFDHEQSEPTTKCDEEFIGPVTFEIEDEEIEIPTSVLKSTAYLQSHLATVAKGLHPHSGKALPRNHNGNVIVTNTTKEIFRLLIAFLCGEDPLSREPFDRVIEVYETLLSETIKWRLSRARLSLPARFWTVSRWSDGNSFFALREKDIQLLTPLPVAKSAISPHNPPVHLQVLPPLEPDQRPPAYDQIAEIAREEPERLKAWGGVDAAVTVALVESEFVTIFFFLPDMREPLAFQSRCRHLTELLPETPREMRNYPHVVAEDENETRQVWFNSHEGIEIRRTNTYRMRQLSSEVPPTQPESLWSRAVWGQANPPLAPIEPKEWTAFHPAIKDTVYKSSMLEYGFVAESLRFYSWGCLVVGRRNRTNLASGLIASVSVDHGDLKEIYQSRINIYLKCNLYDYEIAVSQDLSRVYLCVDGSLLSQALTPMLNRVVFELIPPTAPAKAAKSKLCHVDIAEGAPTAQNLQGFRCLGVLAEFDCYTGVYMQAAISRPLCSITRHVFFNKYE